MIFSTGLGKSPWSYSWTRVETTGANECAHWHHSPLFFSGYSECFRPLSLFLSPLPLLFFWRRRFSRFFSPRIRFSTQRIAHGNLDFLETLWKLYRFRATMLPVPKIPIYRLFDSIVRLYFALWLIIRSWKLGWKERLSRRSKHPVTSIRGTIRCPLTEPRISICAHEIDIETFTLATRPDSYNIFSRRGTEADLHLTSRRPDRVATSILASLRNCFLL